MDKHSENWLINAEAKKSKIPDTEFSDTITKAKAKKPKVAKFKIQKK